MSDFRDGFGTGLKPKRDGLRNAALAENSHFGTGGTGWDRFLPEQALRAHISGLGKMRPNPSRSVPPVPDHDFPDFTPATAAVIRDAWTTRLNNTDREPVRQDYRDNPGLRALIAEIMRDA
jgi:hypothetical protein